jgi:hypothetical protein
MIFKKLTLLENIPIYIRIDKIVCLIPADNGTELSFYDGVVITVKETVEEILP